VIEDHYQCNQFYTFEDHPIIKSLEEQLRTLGCENELISEFSKRIRFLYPKLISFFLGEFSKEQNYTELPCSLTTDDNAIMRRDGTAKYRSVASEKLLSLFSKLLQAIARIQFRPIIVIDMRGALFFDETLLSKILVMVDENIGDVAVVLMVHESIKNILNENIFKRKVKIVFSLNELTAYANELIELDENIFCIALTENVSLARLESIIIEKDLQERVRNALLIKINFNRVSSISCFGMSTIDLLIHTLAHRHGTFFRMEYSKAPTRVVNKILEWRTPEVNSFFLVPRDDHGRATEETVKQFGVYLFDRDSYRSVLGRFRMYMSSVREMFLDYIGEPFAMRYEYPGQTRKAQTYHSVTYHNIIINIVDELVENAVQHSQGVGYLAATFSKYHLFLFVGDCGIGLKKGILKNYQMESELADDRRAIELVFNLPVYKSRRKKDEVSKDWAGYGLADTLYNIFICKGKFIFRTGNKIGAYMNPVSRTFSPPRILDSNLYLLGTQYMILIPLTKDAVDTLPKTAEDFLEYTD
jgi:hypothetical protein